MQRHLAHVALRTSALYWGIGILWILLSDRALIFLFPDPATQGVLQTYKGWFFVTVTALLLYVSLWGQLRRWDAEARARKRAQQELEAALHEKTLMMREIHHRVKNNLQVMSSLLNMHARDLEDPRLQEMFLESQLRIRAMAIVHDKLYDSLNFAAIDFEDFLRSVSRELVQALGRPGIELMMDTEKVNLSIVDAVPCGLIANELLSNAFKHAFPHDRSGTIVVSLHRGQESTVDFGVRDDGIGLPPQFSIEKARSVGLTLVQSLVQQIGGVVTVDGHDGTDIRVKFPV
jgi:two-component sensor histidine kinase